MEWRPVSVEAGRQVEWRAQAGTAVPQLSQKRLPDTSGAPQLAQPPTVRERPQDEQNNASLSGRGPQLGQRIPCCCSRRTRSAIMASTASSPPGADCRADSVDPTAAGSDRSTARASAVYFDLSSA